jgi:hypothetical protein
MPEDESGRAWSTTCWSSTRMRTPTARCTSRMVSNSGTIALALIGASTTLPLRLTQTNIGADFHLGLTSCQSVRSLNSNRHLLGGLCRAEGRRDHVGFLLDKVGPTEFTPFRVCSSPIHPRVTGVKTPIESRAGLNSTDFKNSVASESPPSCASFVPYLRVSNWHFC